MLQRLYERAISFWGVIFFAFLLMYWVRSVTLLSLGLILFIILKILHKQRIGYGCVNRLSGWCKNEERLVLFNVMILGLIARFAWLLFLYINDLSTDISDYRVLWQNSQSMANGVMPISKSWTTAAFYAVGIRLFGVHLTGAYIWTMLLQLMTAIMGYYFCRTILGVFPALVFLVFAVFSPNIIVLSTVTATENLFALFIVVTCILLQRLLKKPCVLLSICMGLVLWVATWSRGEGVILWGATFGVIVVSFFIGKISWLSMFRILVVLVITFILGAICAVKINENCCGDQTIFCSNDNLIPRYMGSLASTAGGFSVAVYDDFDAIHGKGSVARAHQGDRDLRQKWFSYLKRRTAENWAAMSLSDGLKHIIRKEIIDWWGYGTMGLATVNLSYEFVFAPFAAITFALAFFYFILLFRGTCACYDCGYLAFVLAGVICALAISEAQPRYSFFVYWAGAFYAAFFIKALMKQNET